MANDQHSIFMHQQIPTDYSCLANVLGCLPCNLDGLTERLGYFLLFEVKSGEQLSKGQQIMLKALSAIPQFTILMVHCQWSAPNSKQARDFIPLTFAVMDSTGKVGSEYKTNAGDFATRYDIWLRVPHLGHEPFTCSPEIFEEKFLRMLPGHIQSKALLHVKGARGDGA